MLSYGLKGKQLLSFLLLAEVLVAQTMLEPLPPSPLSKTCYRYMINCKIIQTWAYLKANRKIHGALHTYNYQNRHYHDHLMVAIVLQWGKTH